MPLTDTTQLIAFNRIMAAVDRPLVAAVPSGSADVEQAQALETLDESTREVLMEGWAFNTIEEYELTPVANEITIPDGIWVLSFLYETGTKYVEREGKVYNATEGTFTITQTLTARIAARVEFDDCPEYVRNYIAAKAARKFQEKVENDVQAARQLRIEEAEARALVDKYDTLSQRPNLYINSPIHRELSPRARTYRP
jgi:hypothetical protein